MERNIWFGGYLYTIPQPTANNCTLINIIYKPTINNNCLLYYTQNTHVSQSYFKFKYDPRLTLKETRNQQRQQQIVDIYLWYTYINQVPLYNNVYYTFTQTYYILIKNELYIVYLYTRVCMYVLYIINKINYV